MSMSRPLSELVELACLAEAAARKPGNVHPGASFADLTFDHFVTAARIAADTLPAAAEVGVGLAVRDCVRATVAACGTNVNLGIALLLAPLCAVPRGVRLAEGIGDVLRGTTVEDARAVYGAVRLANPGGLGDAAEQDVRDEPTMTLTEAMRLAAGRDRVAHQYTTGFLEVGGMAWVLKEFWSGNWEAAVLQSYLSQLKQAADSHIARRCGGDIAEIVRRTAECTWRDLQDAGKGTDGGFRSDLLFPMYQRCAELPQVARLDAYLRADGHRRNPGTTADLTAAALFWAYREQLVEPPTRDELLAHADAVRGSRS